MRRNSGSTTASISVSSRGHERPSSSRDGRGSDPTGAAVSAPPTPLPPHPPPSQLQPRPSPQPQPLPPLQVTSQHYSATAAPHRTFLASAASAAAPLLPPYAQWSSAVPDGLVEGEMVVVHAPSPTSSVEVGGSVDGGSTDLSMWGAELQLATAPSTSAASALARGASSSSTSQFLHRQHLVVRRVKRRARARATGDCCPPPRHQHHSINNSNGVGVPQSSGSDMEAFAAANGMSGAVYRRRAACAHRSNSATNLNGREIATVRDAYPTEAELLTAAERADAEAAAASTEGPFGSASFVMKKELLWAPARQTADATALSHPQSAPLAPLYSALYPIALSADLYEAKVQRALAEAVAANVFQIRPPCRVEMRRVACDETPTNDGAGEPALQADAAMPAAVSGAVELSIEGLCFVPAHATMVRAGGNGASARVDVPAAVWTLWSTVRSDRYVRATRRRLADHLAAPSPSAADFYVVDFSAAHQSPTAPLQVVHLFDPSSPERDLTHSIPLPWHLDGLIALKIEGERERRAASVERQQQQQQHPQPHSSTAADGGYYQHNFAAASSPARGTSTTVNGGATSPMPAAGSSGEPVGHAVIPPANPTWQVVLPNIDGYNGSLPRPHIAFSQRAQRVFTVHSCLVARHTMRHVLCVWRLHKPYQLVEFIILPSVPWGEEGEGGGSDEDDYDGNAEDEDEEGYNEGDADGESYAHTCGLKNEYFCPPDKASVASSSPAKAQQRRSPNKSGFRMGRFLRRVPQPILSVSLRSSVAQHEQQQQKMSGHSSAHSSAGGNGGGSAAAASPSGDLLFITFYSMHTLVYEVSPPMALGRGGAVSVRPSVLAPARLRGGIFGSVGFGADANASSLSDASDAEERPPTILSGSEAFGLMAAAAASAEAALPFPSSSVGSSSVALTSQHQQHLGISPFPSLDEIDALRRRYIAFSNALSDERCGFLGDGGAHSHSYSHAYSHGSAPLGSTGAPLFPRGDTFTAQQRRAVVASFIPLALAAAQQHNAGSGSGYSAPLRSLIADFEGYCLTAREAALERLKAKSDVGAITAGGADAARAQPMAIAAESAQSAVAEVRERKPATAVVSILPQYHANHHHGGHHGNAIVGGAHGGSPHSTHTGAGDEAYTAAHYAASAATPQRSSAGLPLAPSAGAQHPQQPHPEGGYAALVNTPRRAQVHFDPSTAATPQHQTIRSQHHQQQGSGSNNSAAFARSAHVVTPPNGPAGAPPMPLAPTASSSSMGGGGSGGVGPQVVTAVVHHAVSRPADRLDEAAGVSSSSTAGGVHVGTPMVMGAATRSTATTASSAGGGTAPVPSLFAPDSFVAKAMEAMGRQFDAFLMRRYWVKLALYAEAGRMAEMEPPQFPPYSPTNNHHFHHQAPATGGAGTSVSSAHTSRRDDVEVSITMPPPPPPREAGGSSSPQPQPQAATGDAPTGAKGAATSPAAATNASSWATRRAGAAGTSCTATSLVGLPRRGADYVWEGLMHSSLTACADVDGSHRADGLAASLTAPVAAAPKRSSGLIVVPISLLFGGLFGLEPVPIPDAGDSTSPAVKKKRAPSASARRRGATAASESPPPPPPQRLLLPHLLKRTLDHPSSEPLLSVLLGAAHYQSCRALIAACRAAGVSLWLSAPEEDIGAYECLSAVSGRFAAMGSSDNEPSDEGEGEESDGSDAEGNVNDSAARRRRQQQQRQQRDRDGSETPKRRSRRHVPQAVEDIEGISYSCILRRLIQEVEMPPAPAPTSTALKRAASPSASSVARGGQRTAAADATTTPRRSTSAPATKRGATSGANNKISGGGSGVGQQQLQQFTSVITNICGLPSLRRGYRSERHTALLTRFYDTIDAATAAVAAAAGGVNSSHAAADAASRAAAEAEQELVKGLRETILLRPILLTAVPITKASSRRRKNGRRGASSHQQQHQSLLSHHNNLSSNRHHDDEDEDESHSDNSGEGDEEEDAAVDADTTIDGSARIVPSVAPPSSVLVVMPSAYHMQCLRVVADSGGQYYSSDEEEDGDDDDEEDELFLGRGSEEIETEEGNATDTKRKKSKGPPQQRTPRTVSAVHTILAPSLACSDAYRTDLVNGLCSVVSGSVFTPISSSSSAAAAGYTSPFAAGGASPSSIRNIITRPKTGAVAALSVFDIVRRLFAEAPAAIVRGGTLVGRGAMPPLSAGSSHRSTATAAAASGGGVGDAAMERQQRRESLLGTAAAPFSVPHSASPASAPHSAPPLPPNMPLRILRESSFTGESFVDVLALVKS